MSVLQSPTSALDRPAGVEPRAAFRPAAFVTPRTVILLALGIAWLNFLFTVKWAHLPGALHGWKQPWYATALVLATLLALLVRRVGQPVRLDGLPVLVVAGVAVLAAAFLCSFPPSTWNQIPFFDDWPPRFQATVDGVRLLRRGAVVGWEWAFLGGYHVSADLSQSLSMLALVAMTILGERVGFHLLHAFMVALVPLVLYWDLRAEGSRHLANLTAAFSLIFTAGFFGTIMPSGDMNSIAGVACVVLALAGSRAARLGARWGGPLLVLGLVLALYSHAGFFLYGLVYLTLEVICYRDVRAAARLVVAAAAAFVAALPLYYELLRYGDYFITHNLIYDPRTPVDWPSVARKIFYNTELLLHPHRWFNDYRSLTNIWLPVIAWVAIKGDSGARARYYAWASLATVAMLRFDVPEAGYLFARPMHMAGVFAAPILAYAVISHAGSRWLAWALIAVTGLYVQAAFASLRSATCPTSPHSTPRSAIDSPRWTATWC